MFCPMPFQPLSKTRVIAPRPLLRLVADGCGYAAFSQSKSGGGLGPWAL